VFLLEGEREVKDEVADGNAKGKFAGAAVALEPIADQAAEYGDPEISPLTGRQRHLLADAAPGHQLVNGVSEPGGACPDRAVGAARERVVDELHRQGRWAHTTECALGYAQVHVEEDADLILYNTCSIRDKAEQKVFNRLNDFASF